MRVAFLSPCWPHDRFPNGIASYVSSVRNGLNAAGVETRIIAGEMDGSSTDPDVIELTDSSEGKPLSVRLMQRLTSTLSRPLGVQQILGYRVGKAACALDQDATLDLFEIEETFGIGAIVQRYFKKPVVVRLHGPWCVIGPTQGHGRGLEFWLRCAVEYQAIRKASGVSSPSQDALDRVRRFYRLRLPNARVIPNPVPRVSDEDLWSEGTSQQNEILFVGRFDRVKGADILLQAFAQVASNRPELRLIFIGPDTGILNGAGSTHFNAFLHEHIPSRLHEQILFKDVQTKAQITQQRKRAAITVISSRYETFSIAVTEAMAAGSPLIASRTGGIKEIVRDDENGLLFETEKPHDLARQIERLLDDPALAARLGAAGRLDARERYCEARVAEQTHSFYTDVIRSSERGLAEA